MQIINESLIIITILKKVSYKLCRLRAFTPYLIFLKKSSRSSTVSVWFGVVIRRDVMGPEGLANTISSSFAVGFSSKAMCVDT